ncbi:MAG: rhodanese-related sulfurtransferase [Woeseiaceae bacterium]
MKVVSFYRFLDVDDPQALRDALQALCEEKGLLGTILVADEGVNGTLAGSGEAVQAVLAWLAETLLLADPIEARWTEATEAPFRRMRVRLKKEIVTLGRPDIRPQEKTGRHVAPTEWNELIENPETLVIDTRNHYEVEVGTFANAVDPGTDSFRQFAALAERLAEGDKDRPVAMFCTGGIRCEKASALMLELGFGEVYQLGGGILNYLDQVGEDDNRWNGECFVFDSRVAVDRDLAEGGYVQCHACRRPLSSEDLKSPDFREGVSCPRCIGDLDPERAERLEERRRQVALARARGEAHIGAVLPKAKSKTA